MEELFREDRAEPFFVKNLESVQGDQRDVIILNVGYGRDAAGELSQNFGPLTRQGGERRLNVAVTRAKYHLKLVTSLRAGDIDLAKSKSEGNRLLRAYLDYAERGAAALPLQSHADDGPVNAVFEEAVRAALEANGHTVVPRVGCGHRIDLAVQNPADPSRYLLGVECDGRGYLAAGGGGCDRATARDRDRLTSAVLAGEAGDSGLGWRLHRVWSAEWVKAPEAEVRRIEEALASSQEQEEHAPEQAAATAPDVPSIEPASEESAPLRWTPPVSPLSGHDRKPAGVNPYQRALLKRRGWSDQFYRASHAELLHALKQVIALEGPLRLIDATRRVAAAWDIKTAGRQVQAIVAAAAQAGVHQESFQMKDGFLWPSDVQAPPVRTHEGGEHVRAIEEICVEEIAEAVMLVMRRSFSIPEGDLIVQTARTLGYARTGPNVRARIEQALGRLVCAGRLRRESGVVALGNS